MNPRLFAPLVFLCSTAFAEPPAPKHLQGAWSGTGRFYEINMIDTCGPVSFDLRIDADLVLAGTVNQAKIVPSKAKLGKQRIDYFVVLDTRICNENKKGKDHLVLLITAADSESLRADFHLKTSFGFDKSMHPGSLDARRKP